MKTAIVKQWTVDEVAGRHSTTLGRLLHKARAGRTLAGLLLTASLSSGCDNVEGREAASESEDRCSSDNSEICSFLELKVDYNALCDQIGGDYHEGKGYCGNLADPDLVLEWCEFGVHFPGADDLKRLVSLDYETGMARCYILDEGAVGEYVDEYAPLTDFCPEYPDVAGVELRHVSGEAPDYDLSCFYDPIVDLPCSD